MRATTKSTGKCLSTHNNMAASQGGREEGVRVKPLALPNLGNTCFGNAGLRLVAIRCTVPLIDDGAVPSFVSCARKIPGVPHPPVTAGRGGGYGEALEIQRRAETDGY